MLFPTAELDDGERSSVPERQVHLFAYSQDITKQAYRGITTREAGMEPGIVETNHQEVHLDI